MSHVDADSAPNAPASATSASGAQRSFARAATLTSIGNLSSRVIGLLRESVKAFFFGTTREASAFEMASNLPTTIYDLLIGGMLSSALVPTFSRLAADDVEGRQRALGRLLGALIGLTLVSLTVIIGLMLLVARPLAAFFGGVNQDPDQLAGLYRITFPALLFMNLSGLITAALHARNRFGFTAFTATVFNLTMIACMALFERWIGVNALALGMLAGSVAQVLIQLPGLRGLPIALSLDWRLPGVAQVVRLFLPVAGGLALAGIAAQISFIAASALGANGPATMRLAAQVIQFPLGMVVSAVSIAALPQLASSEGAAFNVTLARGLRLMLVLIAPAAIALFVLAEPVIALLFQRGAFDALSTAETASALRAAVPNLVFSAIDIPFIYAFYARRDTRTPTLVGLVSTLAYIAILGVLALLDRNGIAPFTLEKLIFANSVKTGIDAALMAPLLLRRIGGLRGHGILWLLPRVGLASAAMGALVWGASAVLIGQVGLETLGARLIVLIVCGALGLLGYFGLTLALRIDEARGLLRQVTPLRR
jgi:putative peptidoglycan lipid II flippase